MALFWRRKPLSSKAKQPWSGYAAGSDVDDFADFCAEHLVQWIDKWKGQPLELEAFQMRMMGEALSFNEAGSPIFTSTVIVLPRKNGKTLLLAAYALWRMLTTDGSPEILLAASSDKQAQRLFEDIANFVRQSSVLSGLVRVRDHAGEIRREDGLGVIYRLSSDPARLHGFNPSDVIVDELHAWTTPQLKRAYAALTSGGGARSAPRVFTITTAGEASQRKSSILGRILDDAALKGDVETIPGLTISRNTAAQMLVYNHEAPTADPYDVKSMKLANPAPWITEDFLRKQAENPELTDAQVLQLHGCVWAETETTFVPPPVLGRAMDGFVPLEEGSKVVLGFDGSERRDETWLVACSIDSSDSRLEPLRRWAKPPGDDEWRVPRREVHKAIADAFVRFNVVELAFDPPGWYAEGDVWAAQYGDKVLFFDTNKPARFAPACERMQSALNSAEVKFGGELGNDLSAHFGNCVTRETTAGLVVMKDHPDSPRKIDGAVASIIAFDRASWHAQNPSRFLMAVEYA